jgi:DNA-binding PadR family transcriptional regulator
MSTSFIAARIAFVDTSVRGTPLALTVLALLHHRPLHPYGLQRLIQQWGKDQVVNVNQRAGLHRTIDRLRAAGLIAVRETTRDSGYPERTVYEVTGAGRAAARRWLLGMLADRKPEYPEFPAALSHLLMITPGEARDALRERAGAVAAHRAALAADLAAHRETLPRVSVLETEYQLAVVTAEQRWLDAVLDDLAAGRLDWVAGADPR